MPLALEQQLYNSANAYYQGATFLMKPSDAVGAHSLLIIQPAITCAALSLKLYLKSLLAIEGKDKEDNIFRFTDLFQALGGGMQDLVLLKFDEFSNTQMSSAELAKHLEALDSAFAKWRYIHEEDAKSVNVEDLEEMILAVRSTILSLKPDWDQQ